MNPWTFIGGGQMARALVGGMIAGGHRADQITVIDPSETSGRWWAENMASVRFEANAGDRPRDDRPRDDRPRGDGTRGDGTPESIVVLAVKPNVIQSVCQSGSFAGSLVVSIAAGVTLSKLGGWLGHERIIRVMPNTPSLVRCGAAGYAAGAAATEEDRRSVDAMLTSVGVAVQVDESLINAVTAVSGSGPAYGFMMIEAMADGGVAAGLSRPVAQQLAAATVMGAAKMVLEDGRHPGQLKDAVASPAGTTIAAVASLESSGLRAAMIRAVLAAKSKADQMGAIDDPDR